MPNKTIACITAALFLTACATSSAVFRAGIKFDGDNARQNRYKIYQVDINRSYGVSLISNCIETVHKGTMSFPFIPMPPVLPTGNKVEHLAAKRSFSLLIESAHNLGVNHEEVKISIEQDGKVTDLHFSKQHRDPRRRGKHYEYPTPYLCADIKDAVVRVENLRVAGSPVILPPHRMSFYEDTQWSSN